MSIATTAPDGGMKQTMKEGLSARARLLDTATALFRREGIRAIGVDRVVAEAGVCKMSLYRAFPSKDDLVAAVLSDLNDAYWRWFDGVLARHPDDPGRQIRALFAALAKRTTSPDFPGCPFVNTAVEFRDPDHPGRKVAVAHKQELRRRLEDLCRAAGLRAPDRLAPHLMLLMEGAYSSGNTLGAAGPAGTVAEVADILLAAAGLGP